MLKWLRAHFARHMVRALIYKLFTRAVLTVFAVLVTEFFVGRPSPLFTRANLFLFCALLWLAGAWISHLRMHGLKFPRFDIQRFRRGDPLKNIGGGMADHIDDPVITYADLDDDEKDTVTLLCDLILFPAFVIVSLLV